MDSLIDALENNKYADLTDDLENIILKKIDTKIEAKKEEITNVLNGVEKTEETEVEDDNTDTSTEDDTVVEDDTTTEDDSTEEDNKEE